MFGGQNTEMAGAPGPLRASSQMKSALKISLVANLCLTALVVWLVQRPRAGDVPTVVSVGNPAANALDAQESPGPERQQKFQWSLLESPDYRTYIANLKAIGCPQQTIRDIIVADVDSLYAPRRDQLARSAAAESRLETLNREEASVLAALLGPAPVSTEVAGNTNAAPVRAQRQSGLEAALSARPPTAPLVLQEVNPAALNLTSGQQELISRLRQQFIDQIGGTNQDPNDPDYLARWQKAQRQMDDTLRGTLGIKFFVNYRQQAEAANAAVWPK
jgi:hypothetical protein